MTKNQLDIFIRVAQTGSFSKAANAMYVTPSSVIQQMNLLESDLGAHLLIRTNHGVELTVTGQVLYEEALKITQQFDSAKSRVKKAEDAAHKYIRVGADLCRKPRLFPDYWSQFISSEPYYEAKFVHYGGKATRKRFLPTMILSKHSICQRFGRQGSNSWNCFGVKRLCRAEGSSSGTQKPAIPLGSAW